MRNYNTGVIETSCSLGESYTNTYSAYMDYPWGTTVTVNSKLKDGNAFNFMDWRNGLHNVMYTTETVTFNLLDFTSLTPTYDIGGTFDFKTNVASDRFDMSQVRLKALKIEADGIESVVYYANGDSYKFGDNIEFLDLIALDHSFVWNKDYGLYFGFSKDDGSFNYSTDYLNMSVDPVFDTYRMRNLGTRFSIEYVDGGISYTNGYSNRVKSATMIFDDGTTKDITGIKSVTYEPGVNVKFEFVLEDGFTLTKLTDMLTDIEYTDLDHVFTVEGSMFCLDVIIVRS